MNLSTSFFWRTALAAVLLACGPGVAPAQTVQPISQGYAVTGIAVDRQGNVFELSGPVGTVSELPGGNAGAAITLGTGIATTSAVAIDGSGNVFVADYTTIYEVPAGYASLRTVVGGFQGVTGLAVDGKGDLFVADQLANQVEIILAVDGAIPATPQIVPIGSGFSAPEALVLDAADNVYIADTGNKAVKRILAAGGYATVQTLAGNLTAPQALAVDGDGNVYVADNADGSIAEILAAGGYATVQPLLSGLGRGLFGLAVDAGGDLFIADLGEASLLERPASGGALQNIGSFAGPSVVAIDHEGNLFVGDSSAGAVTELTAASHLTTAVPVTAGLDEPIGIAIDASGNLFVVDLAGTVKEMLAASGYTQIYAIGHGFLSPEGVAVDSSGNVYVADTYDDAVKELTAADGYATSLTLGSGFTKPFGVAVDGSGNVYVADTGNSAVKQIQAVDGSIPADPVIKPLSSGFVDPTGVAVDTGGNVYVADAAGTVQAVRELPAAGGYSQSITLPGNQAAPIALALDDGGDVFVSQLVIIPPQAHMPPSEGSIYEILAGPPVLAASVLPGARSVENGATATVFATMINAGPADFADCSIALAPHLDPIGAVTLHYQPTDPATNLPVGSPDTPVSIAGKGGSQSFILSLTGENIAVNGLRFGFSCSQGSAGGPVGYAAIEPGVDTVDLTMSAVPVPDIIALAATPTGNGLVEIPAGGSAAFAIASLNLGSAAPITVSVDSGGTVLPLTATLCQTDPATAQCLTAPAASASLSFAANAAPTFSVFLQAQGAIAFAPATARLFVRFADASGGLHGSTSVAVETQ